MLYNFHSRFLHFQEGMLKISVTNVQETKVRETNVNLGGFKTFKRVI